MTAGGRGDARRRRRFRQALVLGLLPVLLGCTAVAGAPSAGRRLLADLFVVGTSPVQLPAMAARDAAAGDAGPWEKTLLFPVRFVGGLVRHGALTGLHALDVVATPLHLFDEDEAPRIYTVYRLPMPMAEDAAVGEEAGQILLLSAGTVGGAVIGRWFLLDYLPRAVAF